MMSLTKGSFRNLLMVLLDLVMDSTLRNLGHTLSKAILHKAILSKAILSKAILHKDIHHKAIHRKEATHRQDILLVHTRQLVIHLLHTSLIHRLHISRGMDLVAWGGCLLGELLLLQLLMVPSTWDTWDTVVTIFRMALHTDMVHTSNTMASSSRGSSASMASRGNLASMGITVCLAGESSRNGSDIRAYTDSYS